MREGQHRGRGGGLAAPSAQERPRDHRAAGGAPVGRRPGAARGEDRHRPLVSDGHVRRADRDRVGAGRRARSRICAKRRGQGRAALVPGRTLPAARLRAARRPGREPREARPTDEADHHRHRDALQLPRGERRHRSGASERALDRLRQRGRIHRAAPLHDRGLHERDQRSAGLVRRWTSERTAPDVVVFRLAIPERLGRAG